MDTTYALITPACNEEKYIAATIQSVLAQVILPRKWVIVSDGSTDRTDELIIGYEREYPFIKYLRLDNKERTFFSKVYAIRSGYDLLKDDAFGFIGNLDADIMLKSDYYRNILIKFDENPRLGIASGIYVENINNRIVRHVPPQHHNPGAIIVFRRECYDSIAGFPLLNGGEDAAAGIMARMHNWQTCSFMELEALHLKPFGTGSTRNQLKIQFRLGKIDYHLGTHPLHSIAKLCRRFFRKPYIAGSLALFAGFCYASLHREKRVLSDDAIRFHRKEQLQQLFKVKS